MKSKTTQDRIGFESKGVTLYSIRLGHLLRSSVCQFKMKE